MLIASKYEEKQYPLASDFTYITDSTYSKQQVLDCELHVLTQLGFDLAFPTVFSFFDRFILLADITDARAIFFC